MNDLLVALVISMLFNFMLVALSNYLFFAILFNLIKKDKKNDSK